MSKKEIKEGIFMVAIIVLGFAELWLFAAFFDGGYMFPDEVTEKTVVMSIR